MRVVAGVAALAAVACGSAPTAAPSPSPRWADSCVEQVLYWVDQALARRRDPGYDYQHMGLVADVYDVQRAAQRIALRVQRESGDAAARTAATAAARSGCAAAERARAARDSTSPGGGWPG